jgi:hypothetical protein
LNTTIIIHELKMICKSKKNILFVLTLLALIMSYCFLILPSKQTPDSFHSHQVEKKIEDLSAVQKGKELRGETGFSPMSGRFIYAENDYNLSLQRKLLTAFEEENFVRFAHLRMKDFTFNGITPNELVIFYSPSPGKDINHLYNQTLLRYQGYLQEQLPITYQLIEQKTALQTVQNFLLSSGALLLIFCAIYFSSDMLSKDRRNQSILQGIPVPWYRLINLKTLATFLYTIAVLAGLTLVAVTILTFLNGFGFFEIRVPVMLSEKTSYGQNQYDTISITRFLLLCAAILPLLIYLFIRVNAILGLVFKNTWLVLMISSVILFIERIYYSRTLRELFGIDISFFPQTYFEFGKVITGEKNFLINMESILYEKGIIVLIITVLVVEIFLFATSRIINKRRFYEGS